MAQAAGRRSARAITAHRCGVHWRTLAASNALPRAKRTIEWIGAEAPIRSQKPPPTPPAPPTPAAEAPRGCPRRQQC